LLFLLLPFGSKQDNCMKPIKFSKEFNRDWEFYFTNRPIKEVRDKFNFCGSAVTWEVDSTKEVVSAKEAFYLFDSTGVRYPTNELDDLLGVLMFKKSLNFHIKMWVEGYDDCLQGINVYLSEFINPPEWVKEAFRNQLYLNIP
jgi:hypothetical protein